jgi:hypothetical protein
MLRARFEHQGTTTPKDYQRVHRPLSKNWIPPAKYVPVRNERLLGSGGR